MNNVYENVVKVTVSVSKYKENTTSTKFSVLDKFMINVARKPLKC